MKQSHRHQPCNLSFGLGRPCASGLTSGLYKYSHYPVAMFRLRFPPLCLCCLTRIEQQRADMQTLADISLYMLYLDVRRRRNLSASVAVYDIPSAFRTM